jgi:hypothetical protein
MAFAEAFTGGVFVAIRDGNGDGIADIVVSGGGTSEVKVFSFPALDLLPSADSSAVSVAGVATFTQAKINLAGTGYVLTASATGLTSADSSAFNVTTLPTPTVTVTPGSYVFDGSAQGPTAAIVNRGGSTGAVTLSYAGTGSTVYGPTSTRPTAIGTYTVTATVAAAGDFAAAVSAATPFTIKPSITRITPATGAPNVATTITLTGPNFGATSSSLTSASFQPVGGSPTTVAAAFLGQNSATNTVTWLSQTSATIVARAGFAPGATVDFTITIDGVSSDSTANTPDARFTADFDRKLVFTEQPSPFATVSNAFPAQPVVEVRNANGQTITSFSGIVTLTSSRGNLIGSSPGPITAIAVAGVAKFTGLKIDTLGSAVLTATATGLTSATSNNIIIQPAASGSPRLVFTSASPLTANAGNPFPIQPTVAVQDATGNVFTTGSNSSPNITLSLSGGPGVLSPASSLTKTAVGGVAEFSGLSINRPGTYTISASSSGLTTTSTAITVTAGPAAKLVFTNQPFNEKRGVAFATQPKVEVQDAAGNPVTNHPTTLVTLELKAGTGARNAKLLTPSSSSPVASTALGVATFSGLSIDLAGSNYRLTARAPGLASADSNAFTVFNDASQAAIAALRSRSLSTPPVTSRARQVAAAEPAVSTLAAIINPGGTTGKLVGYIASLKAGFAVDFTFNDDATFRAQTKALTSSTGSGQTLTFSGELVDGVLRGTLAELSLDFSAPLETISSSSPAAGLYQAASLGAGGASTFSLVDTKGQVFVLALLPGGVSAGTGTVSSTGAYTVETAQGEVISGTVNATAATTIATITLAGGAVINVSGLSSTVPVTRRLAALSVLGSAGGSQNITAGFVVSGPKTVLFRGIGPSLGQFGVPNAQTAPTLTLFNGSGTPVLTNNGWNGDASLSALFRQVGAFLLPSTSPDTAAFSRLEPGAYTLRVGGGPNGSVALAEIYDLDPIVSPAGGNLIALSSLGPVVGSSTVLVAGFVIDGNSPRSVLIRGVGPGLAQFGVPDALTTPLLRLYDSTQTLIAQNQSWGTPVTIGAGQTAADAATIRDTAAKVGVFALAAGSNDSSLVITLAPGSYTAQLTGVNNTAGSGLIEIYEIR